MRDSALSRGIGPRDVDLHAELEKARVIVFTGGPLDDTQRILKPDETSRFVGCFEPIYLETGEVIGAYQVVECGDGIARTEWIEPWSAFLDALHETETRWFDPIETRWFLDHARRAP